MEYKEFTAKTVDDAITEATIELGVTSDNLDYEVVSEGSKGLLGIFAKPAVIKAAIKGKTAAPVKEAVKEAAKETVKETAKKPVKDTVKTEAKAEVKKENKKETVKPAEVKTEKKETVSEVKKEKKPSMNSEELEKVLVAFLEDVIEKMNMQGEVEVEINEDEKTIDIDIRGNNAGDIIGKRGQTLDALQYLASIVANKEKEEYYRLKLDTKNYRERRAKTLENLAKNVATKVKKTKHKVVLEPMNPYERRIIHAYLQSDSQVTTKSEGEEPNRRVVVYYKR